MTTSAYQKTRPRWAGFLYGFYKGTNPIEGMLPFWVDVVIGPYE